MPYQSYNPNPQGKRTGDCVVRAISKALNQDWEKTFLDLSIQAYAMADLISSNSVWGVFLKNKGWSRELIPTECADCYTVERFCEEHPKGTYLLAISGHLACVEDGILYDAWNSLQEIPVYYWYKKEEE